MENLTNSMKDNMDSATRGSSQSKYSESPSERTLSPCLRTPSPGPRRGLPASSPVHKQGVRQVPSRPQREGLQKRGGPKNLDLVHKHVLLARLLSMNKQRNAMAELQLRTDELQKENRVLRQLQLRQEKSLQLYESMDSKLEQLLTRHSGETQALRERLRRAQERGREAERSLKETQEQLHRSQAAVGRLRKLAEQRELGPREELRLQLEQEKANTLENQRKIKDLERSIELNTRSYQRQLAAERKKTLSSQEEVRVLQDELERLSNKLKEKDSELDTMNIYANRMLKPSARKDPDSSIRKKAPSRSITKAVLIEDRKLSLGVPNTPCIECTEESPEDDDYFSLMDLERSIQLGSITYQRQLAEERKKTLSLQTVVRVLQDELERLSNKLKELDKPDRRPQVTEEKKKKEDGDQQGKKHQENREELKSDRKEHVLEEKRRRLREGREKEEEERKQRNLKEEETGRRGLVEEEVQRRNQEDQARQEAEEEERRRKEELLATLREIDQQNQPTPRMFSDTDPEAYSRAAVRSPPRYSEPRNRNQSICCFTEPGEVGGLHGDGSKETEWGVLARVGRRGVRAQPTTKDLVFGSYSPSFGRPASRGHGLLSPPK